MPSLPLKLGGDISLLLAGPQVPDEGENGCGSILVVIDCGLSTSGINLVFDKKKFFYCFPLVMVFDMQVAAVRSDNHVGISNFVFSNTGRGLYMSTCNELQEIR